MTFCWISLDYFWNFSMHHSLKFNNLIFTHVPYISNIKVLTELFRQFCILFLLSMSVQHMKRQLGQISIRFWVNLHFVPIGGHRVRWFHQIITYAPAQTTDLGGCDDFLTCAIRSLVSMGNLNFSTNVMAALLFMPLFFKTSQCCNNNIWDATIGHALGCP